MATAQTTEEKSLLDSPIFMNLKAGRNIWDGMDVEGIDPDRLEATNAMMQIFGPILRFFASFGEPEEQAPPAQQVQGDNIQYGQNLGITEANFEKFGFVDGDLETYKIDSDGNWELQDTTITAEDLKNANIERVVVDGNNEGYRAELADGSSVYLGSNVIDHEAMDETIKEALYKPIEAEPEPTNEPVAPAVAADATNDATLAGPQPGIGS